MQVIVEHNQAPIKMWTDGVPVEEAALDQLRNVAKMPFIYKHIAVMPDVHYGIGATVGSVIPTLKAVIPAAVGVDIGCFSGDTEIPLVDGSIRTLQSLVGQGAFLVYACDSDGWINVASATAKKTRSNAQLLRVRLDNGEDIFCTPDHEFMLKDKSYKRADKLTVNDSLMPFYTKKDKDGYLKINQPNVSPSYYQRAHWLTARSCMIDQMPDLDSDFWCLHHKDENVLNNLPENLEFITASDHARYHFQKRKSSFWQTEDFEKKRLMGIRRLWCAPEKEDLRKAHIERVTNTIVRYMKENKATFLQKVADNGKRGAEYLKVYNTSEQGRKKSKEIGAKYYPCEFCGEMVKSTIGLVNHKKKFHASVYKHNHNHKIVSVEMTNRSEDVYCLTVPEFGNFALKSGVFVHNCGMCAVQTNLKAKDLPDSLQKIRLDLEKDIPVGFNAYLDDNHLDLDDIQEINDSRITHIFDQYGIKEGKQSKWNQLGTLGGGNHFFELCLDEVGSVWVMLHSGSRGVGNKIGSRFIELARKDMELFHINLPDRDLAYLPEGTEHFSDYVFAVEWAQRYAARNRKVMLRRAIAVLQKHFPKLEIDLVNKAVNCHHNYISRENHFGQNVIVTRKGAVSARAGHLGIIPGSMGAKSFIVVGKGNAESFHSCSHGAGRRMSRNQAKQQYTVDDHCKATEGVECRKDEGVLDETPMAYKDIDAVMAAQSDLVEVLYTLKQVLCIKG